MHSLTEKLDKLAAVDAKLDKLLSAHSSRAVHMVHNDVLAAEEEEGQFEELCYMQNQGNFQRNHGNYGQNQNNFQQTQGTYNAYRQNPTFPYRNQNASLPLAQAHQQPQQQAPPPPYPPRQPYHNNNFKAAPAHPPSYQAPPPPPFQQQSAPTPDVTAMFQQLLHKIDGSHTDLNNKLDKLSARLTSLESQQASSSVQTAGHFPGKDVPNPKEYNIHSISIRDDSTPPRYPMHSVITEDSNIKEGEDGFSKIKVEPNVKAPYTLSLDSSTRQGRGPVQLPEVIYAKHEKHCDPGTFTIPCSLGPLSFDNCLCDLGAAISLMPLSVAKRLGFVNYKPCKISLVFADRSVRVPHGLLEDLPVRVGNVEIPTDFVVLDMDEEPKDPLLLGRPFLATAGAVIDVPNGLIQLNVGRNFRETFEIKNVTRKPTIEGQPFSVEVLEQTTNKPPKRPRLMLVKSTKASDFRSKAPMYDEVIDGRSLKSLFACEVTADPSPTKCCKLPLLDLGPDIVLKPIRYADGVMEYKVKSGKRPKPFAKVKQLLSPSQPQPDWSGPFDIKEVTPCGAITVVSKDGDELPVDGQMVKLFVSAITPERIAVPPDEPPI